MEHEERKVKRTGVKQFFTTIAAGVIGSVLTLVSIPYIDNVNEAAPNVEQQEEAAPESAIEAEPMSSKSMDVADIVEQSSEAIVGVVNVTKNQQRLGQEAQEQQTGTGSGVIYKVTDDAAYIITNNHVIEGASKLQVSLHNGKSVDAELVGTDALTDIAVLKMAGNYDLEPLEFGDSDALRAGNEVLAIGNPLGLELSRTVTQGIVSAVDRTIPVATSAGNWDLNVIQTDAAINPGNSGGALINSKGELVGINSLKITESGVEGLGFAIPINDVSEIVKEISKNGQVVRPFLGVGLASLQELPPFYLENLPENVKEGAIVASVAKNSAAEQAGLKPEDIIISLDGEKIADDHALRKALYTDHKIGDKVTLEIVRNGEVQKVDVTLSSNEQTQQS